MTTASERTFEIKGQIVTSTLSDQDAASILREGRNLFGQDLAAKFRRYGWSPSQRAWAHKLAVDATTPRPPVEGIDGTNLRRLFDNAGNAGLKRPGLSLFDPATGQSLQMRINTRGQRVGCINVSQSGYGSPWFGRFELDGTFTEGGAFRNCEGARDLIRRICADPVGVASALGKATGCCVFCSRNLTDERSTEAGYGPVCANKWGLPWGG